MKKLILFSLLCVALMCVNTSLQAQDDKIDQTEIILDNNPDITVSYQQFDKINNQVIEKQTESVDIITLVKPPLGCGTDTDGVKYCCNPYGHCWPENW